MTIVVREPIAADLDRLAAINVAAWRSAYAGIVSSSYLEAMDVQVYRERWASRSTPTPGQVSYVGEIDRLVTTYGVAGWYRSQEDAAPEDTTGWGEIYALYTDPMRQGRGVGSAVHRALLGWLRRELYVEAALWVLADNHSSRAWYKARGWHADGATSLWNGSGVPLPELRLRQRLDVSHRQQRTAGATD